ncbi:substrate-binding periplasmic protein [Marinobacter sp. KMM 10035]|uniref:substrate-binding periplasmic protein n=1 Tax=Marinobacter sp. KMM 10035 TaxID=3134034 RepID=UPI00397E810B
MRQATNNSESATLLILRGASCAGLFKAVVLAISLLGYAAQSFAECSITLRWDDDAPYFIPQRGRVAGIDADISREVMRRMNCNLTLVKLPWARGLVELRQGRIDMVSGAHRTPEREKYAHYANTVPTISPNLLFIRRSDKAEFRFSGLREVLDSGFKLGAQINVSYSEEYGALVQDSRYRGNIEYTSRRDSLWRMLALNRIDGVIADKLTAMHEIHGLGLSDRITYSSMVVSSTEAHYIFSKESVSPEFVADFDRALEAMQNDGTYSAIVHRYVCPSCRDMPD